jgi:hypothetical protein
MIPLAEPPPKDRAQTTRRKCCVTMLRVMTGLTNSSVESYCCPISVNRGSTWNGRQKTVASGPGLLSSTGFLSPPAPRGLEQVGPNRFVGSVSSIPQRFFGPALTCRPFFVGELKSRPLVVMAGLVPAIHVFLHSQDVDARDKRGHDEGEICASQYTRLTGGSPRNSTRSTFCHDERNRIAVDCRVMPPTCGVSSSRDAASPETLSSGLSAPGGSVE